MTWRELLIAITEKISELDDEATIRMVKRDENMGTVCNETVFPVSRTNSKGMPVIEFSDLKWES